MNHPSRTRPSPPGLEGENLSAAAYQEKLRIIKVYQPPPLDDPFDQWCRRFYPIAGVSGGAAGAIHAAAGPCLQASGTSDGSAVVAATCSGAAAQVWTVLPSGQVTTAGGNACHWRRTLTTLSSGRARAAWTSGGACCRTVNSRAPRTRASPHPVQVFRPSFAGPICRKRTTFRRSPNAGTSDPRCCSVQESVRRGGRGRGSVRGGQQGFHLGHDGVHFLNGGVEGGGRRQIDAGPL